MQLMVAAALVLLCTKPHHVGMNGDVSWLLTVPSIAIIGREVNTVLRSKYFFVRETNQ